MTRTALSRYPRLALALFSLVVLTLGAGGCQRGESEQFTRAVELERKLLMKGGEVNYAHPDYLRVAEALEAVPPWSTDYERAHQKLTAIKDARRLKANEVYELDYLPRRLEGVSLSALAPPQPDSPANVKKALAARPAPAPEPAPAPPETLTRVPEPVPASTPVPVETAKAGKSQKKHSPVIMYTTSWCGFCRKARAYFNQRQVAFLDKDVEQDPAAAREMAGKVGGYGGVPVIDIDGTIIHGFDVRAIDAALAKRK